MNRIDFDLKNENLNLMLQMKALLAGHHSRYFLYLKDRREKE